MWLSAHLYYNGYFDEFLRKAIYPFVCEVKQDESISSWFFVRYWEYGPHIRLRFQAEQDVLQNYLHPKLQNWFSNYFHLNPSTRFHSEKNWFPNNSIQFIEYEPEIARYGGPEAIRVAEMQFQKSSEAVLMILEDQNKWNQEYAIGTAIQMHFVFAHCMKMNIAEMHDFFSIVFKQWFLKARFHPGIPSKGLYFSNKETLQAFQLSLDKHAPVLLPSLKKLRNHLIDNTSFSNQNWLGFWIESMKNVHEMLYQCQNKKLVAVPPYYDINKEYTFDNSNKYCWAIYTSYVHMTNNRLGISNRDEGYIGFLIREATKVL